MAEKADGYVYVTKWHDDYQPYPHVQVDDIYSGLRAPIAKRAKDVTSPCQYWIKGMPGICKNFQDDKCKVEPDDKGQYPTGYNNGKCDYLGRRNWCSQYDNAGTEDLEKYTCIAPDMFRTGLGQTVSGTKHLVLIPYPKSEILGYNADDKGAGQCDGLGMGRGKNGKDKDTTDPEVLYKLPVVCRHYKPWIMGFGAIKPRPMGTAVLEGKDIYDGSESDPLTSMSRYLPFSFRMLNLRATYQKCAYWDQDFGTDFEMNYSGGYATIILPEDPLTKCTCTNDASKPYKTIVEGWPEHSSDTLVNVLTEEGNFICNGAHSECPCYTGKWYFCVADNMCDGMRITAEQILEIRFWTAVWQTKEIYDSIFAEKSGPLDITTSDLYTFDKWEKLGADVNDSVMKGKRIYQCFPIPFNQRVFDPEVYLTKKAITYPKADAKTGTSDSKKSSFPTLIRKVDEAPFVPPLDVIYPYPCKDPWGIVPCKDDVGKLDLMEVASCKMETPATAIFGYTIRNKNVYALNINKLSSGKGINFEQFKKTIVSFLPGKEKKNMNVAIKDLIETNMENGKDSKYIVNGQSNKYGYFSIGPLSLEYNTTTTIAIICEWTPSNYEVVIREVESKFYGAAIVQDTFEFKYGKSGSYGATLPSYFSPSAKLSGKVHTFGGDVHSIFPVYNLYVPEIIQDKVYYSYCVNEYTVDGDKAEAEKWVRIGPTGYIIAEIDNVDISYLFDFEITKAYIRPKNDPNDTSKNLNVCGDTSGTDVKLETVYPKSGDPDAIKRKHLLANSVLLKSKDPQGFFNEDWTLYIEYKYKKLEGSKPDENVKIVWPSGLDAKNGSNKFVDPPFTFVRTTSEKFEVKDIGIKRGTVAIMAYIKDDDDRVQAASATKMLLDVVTTRCRNIDIFYSYRADAKEYGLIPSWGFFTWKGSDLFLAPTTHVNTPICGDHECTPGACVGPVWFPFNSCQTYDYYSYCQGPSTCTLPVEGGKYGTSPLDPGERLDYRYRLPNQYEAYTSFGGNWAADCGNGWTYSYSVTGQSYFVGYGNIKTMVNRNLYIAIGWQLPPFGNDGRECTERWLSQDFYSFWDLSFGLPVLRTEYMPLVFDDEMLFTSFDAFEELGRIGSNLNDYFHTTSMLNNMLSGVIEEKILVTYKNVDSSPENARVRFKDLFEVIAHGDCMYPPPPSLLRRYGFKDVGVKEKKEIDGQVVLVSATKGIAWAWREYWKDIERSVDDTNILNFVDFNRPPYYFDFTKKEHRLITDEGNININFIAPVEEDGEFTYPEISIGGVYPRKFKIIYDDYNDEQIEWMDEGGKGLEGGSGGTEEVSIYEKAMGGGWFHGANTIFDENASAEVSDDRKIIFGETSIGYNRGLIANIPKNRLIYLPYEINDEPVPMSQINIFPSPDSETEYYAAWYNDSVFSKDIVFSYSGGACINHVSLNGHIGVKERDDYYFNKGIYCKPEITIAECNADDKVPCPNEFGFAPSIIYESEGEKGGKYDYSKYEMYNIDLDLLRSPKRMFHLSPMFQTKLTLFKGQHIELRKFNNGAYIHIYSGEYTDATETIKVWEQRYITSTGEFGDENPDGPKSGYIRSHERNRKNAGQYFPSIDSRYKNGINCLDKMTMINMDKSYSEDESLVISKNNLKDIEAEEQKKLYDKAYNMDNYDEMTYIITLPPNIQQFFDANNIDSNVFGGSCQFISERLPWDKHELVSRFQQEGDFWQAGGHYYIWGPGIYRTRCTIFGPIEDVYAPVFVHVNHGGSNEIVMDPHHAYVGWSRYAYLRGLQSIATREGSGLVKGKPDLLLSAKTLNKGIWY